MQTKCHTCRRSIRKAIDGWHHVPTGQYGHKAHPGEAMVAPKPPSTNPKKRKRKRLTGPAYLDAKSSRKNRNKGRLPDSARFDLRFNAKNVEWSGTLTIPGREPITAMNSGVFKLLGHLDDLFRDQIERSRAEW